MRAWGKSVSLAVVLALASILAQAVTAAGDARVLSVASTSQPAGYTVVSKTFTAPNGVMSLGYLSCPKTSSGVVRKVLSGGVVVTSSSLLANVMGNYPTANGITWAARVGNGSGQSLSYTVYAVCAVPRSGYAVVQSTFDNPAGQQTTGGVTCPIGSRVTGGGGVFASGDLLVGLNSSSPGANGWYVTINNASTTDNTVVVYAVCSNWGSRQNYTVYAGSVVNGTPGGQSEARVGCPLGRALGGGISIEASSLSVNVNATWPLSSGLRWADIENNPSAQSVSMIPYVICAT